MFLSKIKSTDPNRDMTGIEAAALAYLHTYQIVRAIQTCPVNDINCQTKQMTNEAMDPIIGFKGWHNRIAQFDYTLKNWKDSRFMKLEN